MEIKSAFNLLLLSLSITTLLVTLVSYIVFRLRYAVQRKHTENLHHLEGFYFRRFAPHLEYANQKHRLESEKKSQKRKIWKDYPVGTFVIIGGLITLFLSLENYLAFRRELTSRLVTATRYRQLLQKGLLQRFQFSPPKDPILLEHFSDGFEIRHKKTLDLVRSLTVQVYAWRPASPTLSLTVSKDSASQVLNRITNSQKAPFASDTAWEEWLSRTGIQHRMVSKCSDLQSNTFTIISEGRETSTLLPASERDCIRKRFLGQGQFVLSGFLFADLLEAQFGLTAVENPEPQQNFPTQFAWSPEFAWDLPPGLLMPWYPTQNQKVAVGPLLTSAAFQAPFMGLHSHASSQIASRIAWKRSAGGRSAWIAMSPSVKAQQVLSSTEERYHDDALLNLLAWSAGLPRSQLAIWPRGQRLASVLAIDSEEKFTNLPSLIELIKDEGHPVTAFLVTDLYLDNLKSTAKLDDRDELGSHTDNHRSLRDFTAAQNFERLQHSRLDLEENWQRAVRGFRPPEEVLDAEATDITRQSGYRYVFGDQKEIRYYPMLLSHGDFSAFFRTMDDDVLLKRNHLLATPQDIASRLIAQVEVIASMGGAAALSIHTHIAGEDSVLKEGVRAYLKHLSQANAWRTTLSEVEGFARLRSSIVTQIRADFPENPSSFRVTIHNLGKATLKDGRLILSLPSRLTPKSWQLTHGLGARSLASLRGTLPAPLSAPAIPKGPGLAGQVDAGGKTPSSVQPSTVLGGTPASDEGPRKSTSALHCEGETCELDLPPIAQGSALEFEIRASN